jgi:hypothetical protein
LSAHRRAPARRALRRLRLHEAGNTTRLQPLCHGRLVS